MKGSCRRKNACSLFAGSVSAFRAGAVPVFAGVSSVENRERSVLRSASSVRDRRPERPIRLGKVRERSSGRRAVLHAQDRGRQEDYTIVAARDFVFLRPVLSVDKGSGKFPYAGVVFSRFREEPADASVGAFWRDRAKLRAAAVRWQAAGVDAGTIKYDCSLVESCFRNRDSIFRCSDRKLVPPGLPDRP